MTHYSHKDDDTSALKKLVELSRFYGGDSNYVLAGGGNTSWKNDEVIYVKASGFKLGSITPEGFVKMHLKKLENIWIKQYAADPAARENEVLRDLKKAKFLGEEHKRPSVEVLLHSLIPLRFVVHTHPALVNGLTCSVEGRAAVERIFGTKALWIPVTDPGYTLAKVVKDAIDEHLQADNNFPQIIFIENHGVFVAGDSPEEIHTIYKNIMRVLQSEIQEEPDTTIMDISESEKTEALSRIRSLYEQKTHIAAFRTPSLMKLMETGEAEKAFQYAFTPDHIVYFGYKPLYVRTVHELPPAVKQYEKEDGRKPRIILVHGIGAFACNTSPHTTALAQELFIDDIKIAVYSKSFGGFSFMPKENNEFIRNWEAEKYRASLDE